MKVGLFIPCYINAVYPLSLIHIWSDLQRTSRVCLQIHTHFYLLWQADTHQSYIITDKVQFCSSDAVSYTHLDVYKRQSKHIHIFIIHVFAYLCHIRIKEFQYKESNFILHRTINGLYQLSLIHISIGFSFYIPFFIPILCHVKRLSASINTLIRIKPCILMCYTL